MKRAKQGSTASPRELLCASKDNKLQAKKTALYLVEKSLNSHILSSVDNHNILRALCSALALPESEISKLRKPRVHSSTESSTSTTKKSGRSNSFDDHDEICEVCEKGGDLLCCDTCTLVFHLKCIRPKLSVVPKGHWSCPHCIIDDLADGDICAAKRSIRSMTRLARGIDSDDDSGFTATGGPEAADPMRVSRLGEYSIVRKGKKFVLRKAERKQMVDIGKYLSLEEAMNYIKEEQFNAQQEAEKSATVEAAKKTSKRSLPHSSSTSSLQKRRRGNDADTAEDAMGTELDDERPLTEFSVSPRRSVSDSSMSVAQEAASNADSQGQDGSSTTNSYDELWCTHCLDDKGVTICAFCGCKKCYGKYDSSLLILCDYCDRETHTYCLDPPLSAVPEEDPWYCQSCTAEGVPDNVSDGEGDGEGSEGQGYDESGSEADSETGRRGMGRPRLNRSGSYSSTTSMVDSQGSFDEPNDGTVIYKKWGRGFKKIVAGSASKTSDDGKRGKYQTKAMLAAAAAAQQLHQQQQAAPKHRGRGRPPGSGKRIIPTTTGLLGSTSSLLSDYSHTAVRPALKFGEPRRKASISSSMSGASTSSTAAIAAAATAEYKLKTKLQSKSYLSGGWGADHQTAEDQQDYTMGQDSGAVSQDEDAPGSVGEEESTQDAVEEVFELGAPGVASVLKIIARASSIRGKVDNGPWTDAELDQLDYVRGWGPAQDLNRVLAALLEQKDILVKKILATEPGFVCKDLENSIVAQITEARAAAAALAATAQISDSLSAGAPSVASGPIATSAVRPTGTAKTPRWKKPKTAGAAAGKATSTPGTGKKGASAAPLGVGAAATASATVSAGPTTTVPPMASPAAAMTANLTQKVGTPHAVAVTARPLPVVAIPASSSTENVSVGLLPPIPAPIS